MPLTTHILRFTFLASLVACALGINYLSAWSGPPDTPPNCPAGEVGCDVPLNVGTGSQIKDGNLSIGAGTNQVWQTGLTVFGRTVARGNIGINAAPDAELDVSSSTATTTVIVRSGAGDARIQFERSNNLPVFTTGIDRSDGFKYKLSSSNELGTEDRFSVTQNGRVGINTATTSFMTTSLNIAGVPGTDGIKFPDGTVQTTAYATSSGTGALANVRSYTTPGTYTWTKPSGLSYVVVEIWGGGGAGQNYGGSSDSTSNGATSTFGVFVSASGGSRGLDGIGGRGGVGVNGDVNLQGGQGEVVEAYDGDIGASGGNGGAAPRGGAGGTGAWAGYYNASDGMQPGGGGGGGAGDHHAANQPTAGGAGGYAYKRISASTLPNSVNLTIGAGGQNIGVEGNGGDGGNGMIIVYEYQ